MNGTIVAINRNLGALVVETQSHQCVVLEAPGPMPFAIGEIIEGAWDQPGEIILQNPATGAHVYARVQQTNITRSQAVGSTTVF
ncbi:MAG: hypothetical protein NUV50_02525 [Rhodospirillales bacterium]|nr:hypothetical protein [Rhodospirillales bacterium]